MESPQPAPSLDEFLMALRYEGIAVGPHEVVRLQHAFALMPTLERQDLKDLLACTLVKHQAHREAFTTLFEAWCPPEALQPVSSLVVSTLESVPGEPQRPGPEPDKPPDEVVPERLKISVVTAPKRHFWHLALLALLILLGVVCGGDMALHRIKDVQPRPQTQQPPPPSESIQPPPRDVTELPTEPAPQFWTWVPTVTAPPLDPLWPALVVTVLPLLCGVVLWRRYRQRYTLPLAEPPPAAGPDWLPLPVLPGAGPALLDREALRKTVWGITGFVSEDATSRVDVERTVQATAQAAGVPTIHFAPAVYPCEVWLWRDTMVHDPIIERLCAELTQSLSRAGLPVRQGVFTDTPGLVRWHDGQEFSPLVLEGHRQSALVLLLTDGYGLQLAAQSAVGKAPLLQVLRAFGEWSRLAFVDVSAGAHGLTTFLQLYGLRCIAPDDIPTFLGAGPVQPMQKRRADTALVGDLGVWAAATALAPEPVTPDSAFALRQHLALVLAPGDLQHLLSAADSGDSLVWSPVARARLLNWLVQCSRTADDEVSPASPLARALECWVKRYQDASRQRQTWQSRLLPWQRTPAEQRVRMELAFLELWCQPEDATKKLYGLRKCLESEIKERFTWLRDWSSRQQQQQEGVVYLPWDIAEQPAHVRWMLACLGFGGSRTPDEKSLRWPIRLSLGLGVCAGLVSIGLWTILGRLLAPDLPTIQPVLPGPLQTVMIQDLQRSGLDTYQLTIGTHKVLQVATVPAGSTVQVDWRWQAQDNVQALGQSELWRAGTLPQAIRGCETGWPRRSLVVIQATPGDRAARQLAIQLLDRGSVDTVLLGWIGPDISTSSSRLRQPRRAATSYC